MGKAAAFIEAFKKKKYAYFVVYTLGFAVTAAFVFRYFILYGKTFIDNSDGLIQNFNTMLYYSKLLKSIIKDVLSGNGINIPMWDFNLGMGEDIVELLNYHLVGDPLTLIGAIWPGTRIDYMFCFMYIIRLYLGGLAFSWFSFYHKNGRFGTLI
nr:hypothetical protein [Lachnospiraceae bacterium]